MPTAGDEGYEHLVSCPYDKSHEIRRGRMQFHLDKCRKNFPEKAKEMVQCPFNSMHLIPRYEEMFHTQEECSSRANFDRFTHQIGDTVCPVKDLVPVNAGTSSVDADENWDNYETQTSVLNLIKQHAEEKPILRMMQCESKAKRKNFRMAERKRYEELVSNPTRFATESTTSPSLLDEAPLRRPTTAHSIPVKRQDPVVAAATLNSCFKSLDLNKNSSKAASSLPTKPQPKGSSPTSTKSSVLTPLDEPSTSSYAASISSSRPTSALSFATAQDASEFQPAPFSYASVSSSRPTSSMSSSRLVDSCPATALASNRYSKMSSGDGFCQVPLPGLGRGSRRKIQN